MEKLFNLRPIVLAGLLIMAGIILGYYVDVTVVKVLSVCLLIIGTILISALILFSRKRKNCILMAATLFMMVIIGFSLTTIKMNRLAKFSGYVYETNEIECTISSAKEKGTSVVIYADHIAINGNKVDGNCRITYYGNHYKISEFRYGAKLVLSEVKFKEKNILKPSKSGTVFNVSLRDANISSLTPTKNIFIKLRNTITDKLVNNNSSAEYVNSLEVGMLFGEKAYMSEEMKDAFSISGLSHLLAVSGLHVGFILTLLNILLNRLFKRNVKLIFITEAVVLIVYAFICDFSPSIVRASLMAIISMFATVRGKQYDGLNALALSAIILTLFDPLTIFNVGFELSYACVFSMACLSGRLNYLFTKVMPEKLSGTLSIGLSATLGTFPIIAYYFNSFSVLSVLVNLIAVPFASICFMSMVVCLIIWMLLPFMSFVMALPNFLYKLLASFAYSVSSISFANTELFINLTGAILLMCVIIFLGDYLFLKRKQKYAFAITLSILSILVITLG